MLNGFNTLKLGWLWRNPLFLVDYGRLMLISILGLLVLLEVVQRSMAGVSPGHGGHLDLAA